MRARLTTSITGLAWVGTVALWRRSASAALDKLDTHTPPHRLSATLTVRPQGEDGLMGGSTELEYWSSADPVVSTYTYCLSELAQKQAFRTPGHCLRQIMVKYCEVTNSCAGQGFVCCSDSVGERCEPGHRKCTDEEAWYRYIMTLDTALIEMGTSLTAIEGHTALVPNTVDFMRLLARLDGMKTVCEIGFNAGHGTYTWVSANPNLRVFSFDNGSHDYTASALDLLHQTFPKAKVELILGDSKQTVPRFALMHPSERCDLLFIDGDHTLEGARADLVNMRMLAVSGGNNLVALDDFLHPDVRQAWEEQIEQGHIIPVQPQGAEGRGEAWAGGQVALGRYVDTGRQDV